jgi:urate oxidase
MCAVLAGHSYGKSRVRITKVTRVGDRHEVRELTIGIELTGDFAASYTHGDNSLIVATDTMKNIAFALAKEHPLESIEEFATALAAHFLKEHSQVESSTVRIAEQPLERIDVKGRAHPHAFVGRSGESRTCSVQTTRAGTTVDAGIDGLFLLKTTGSAFTGFVRDRFTTLADFADRLLATMLLAHWRYFATPAGWSAAHAVIRKVLLETFAEQQSLSVQHTLHAMGTAALAACPEIDRITLSLPNKHRILVDLKPFGLDNANEVFIATDEPHGTITGTLVRG